jgi:hypothetical protein
MTTCIACNRQFSDETIQAVVTKRSLRTDPLSLEYPAENAALYPLCEDHGLKHLDTPKTRSAFKASYFDPNDSQDDDFDAGWDEIDQEKARLQQAEAALRAAQNQIYFGKRAKRRRRR